ncbi:MAG: TCR/Tet family MFS transporter [Acidobacteriia bacterium]|nr:TCR/Tet family MFS transporter [Terriglobia bacterium]
MSFQQSSPGGETSPASTNGQHGRAAFFFIIITVALDFLAFGIIAPVLPKLVVQFEGGRIASAASIVGYFGFAWAAMQFLFSPLIGAWSDRFGRRPIILLSCAGLGIDYVFMALAPSLRWLFVGRLISGVTTSNVSTAYAYITDVTPPEGRAKKFGLLGAAFGIGFVIGPALGGLLGAHNLRYPFWAAAALSLANALYGFFILPESLPAEKRAKSAWHLANPLGSLTLLRSHPELGSLALVIFLHNLAHQSLPSVFVLYTDYRYGWDARTVGLALAVIGVFTAIVSGGLVGVVIKRLGERRGLLYGLSFGLIGFLGFAGASRGRMLFLAAPLIALWAVSGPALQSLMSRRVDASAQGKLQGAISSLRAITGLVGPLLFTQVFAFSIAPKLSVHLPGAPYILAGLLLFIGMMIAVFATRSAAAPAEQAAAASFDSVNVD